MSASHWSAVVAGASILLSAPLAIAQDTGFQQRDVSESMRQVRPPRNAFEIALRGGYVQGFGRLQEGVDVGDTAGAGGSITLGLSYRLTPRISIGFLGTYQQYDAEQRRTTARGLVTGLDFTYHVRPTALFDPWLSLGAGHRFLWDVPDADTTQLVHGVQLARVTVGLDARATEDFALGPYAGADLNLFMWQYGRGHDGALPDERRLNTFVTAGLSGRFDIGGTRDSRPETPAYARSR